MLSTKDNELPLIGIILLAFIFTQCGVTDNSPDPDNPTTDIKLQHPENGASVQSTTPLLKWSAGDEVSEYEVEISTTDDFSNPRISETVTDTSFEAPSLENGTTFYWHIKAISNSGNDKWTDTWTFTTPEENNDPPPPQSAFVGVNNGDFEIDGQTYDFVGTNAYYLPNYEELDDRVVDRALDAFDQAGIKVIRMWAFYDGYDCGYSAQDSSETVIQPSPGEYNEQALQALDRVIAKGKERGMRFVLTLVNYWDDLGGVCQYNTWDGASDPSQNLSHFINDEDTQRWFKNYIDMLLNRTNTETGTQYKNEPAVFSWEIMNEAQLDGGDPQVLRDWYQEIAQYIKSIDSNHMVATGEEGYDADTPSEYTVEDYSNTYVLRADRGTSFIMNTAIPEIDYASAHWYPANWGFGTEVNSDLLTAQEAWVRDHQEIAQSYDKPLVLGEFGFPGWGDDRTETVYEELFNSLETHQVAGDMLWQFTADWVKCYEYGGNICWPRGREDEQLYNIYRDHIQAVEAQN